MTTNVICKKNQIEFYLPITLEPKFLKRHIFVPSMTHEYNSQTQNGLDALLKSTRQQFF